MNADKVAAAMPTHPGPRVLATYLVAVAAALTLAWLPGMIMTSMTGDIAEAVGPYTSAATEALDLGIVVPIAVIASIQLLRKQPLGSVLALIMLVINVCIGVLLIAQGVAQLVSGVPLTAGEIVTKMLTFAALTLVAGSLLARMARVRLRGSGPEMKALVVYESMFGNTEQIARAVAEGLGESVGVQVVEVADAAAEPDPDVALIVAGGPTHAFSMARSSTAKSIGPGVGPATRCVDQP
jgi:Flavodoxin